MQITKLKIAIIGLGYVGLQLAVKFSEKYPTIGFDTDAKRVLELKNLNDKTLQFSKDDLKKNKKLIFSNKVSNIVNCNFFIITVPTPIKKNKNPDLSFLIKASILVGRILKNKDIVVYESTVYPGVTEEICVPILKKNSKLNFFNDDSKVKKLKGFYVGYSPERINPGDKKHTLLNIKKVTSGSSKQSANFIDRVYGNIIKAGTFKAKSIKIAESAKVIENIQRDVNIALINEFAQLFDRLNLDTQEILKTASTKWNFISFKPGLVGGHCIGVDPYYLTYKAQSINFNPKIMLAGRNINDNMCNYILKKLFISMRKKNIDIKNSKILIMGYTFKENCPDIRNSQVINLVKTIAKKVSSIEIYDPWVKEKLDLNNKKIKKTNHLKENNYDSIIIAVAHKIFYEIGAKKIKKLGLKNSVIFDIKYLFSKKTFDLRI